MFNLIFEELMVSVLSHRWDSTVHPQDCQGVSGKSAVREWDVPFWLHPDPNSPSGLGPGSSPRLRKSSSTESPSQAEAVRVTLSGNTPYVIVEWDLWKPPSWWLVSVIYSALSMPHPATAHRWIPPPWVKSSGDKISGVKLLTCDCKAFSLMEKNTGWMNGFKWAGY